jgi:hypothetical protein
MRDLTRLIILPAIEREFLSVLSVRSQDSRDPLAPVLCKASQSLPEDPAG